VTVQSYLSIHGDSHGPLGQDGLHHRLLLRVRLGRIDPDLRELRRRSTHSSALPVGCDSDSSAIQQLKAVQPACWALTGAQLVRRPHDAACRGNMQSEQTAQPVQ